MKIVFSSNISWSIYNFRFNLLKSLKEDGHIIYTVSNSDEYAVKLEKEGFLHTNINVENNSRNPLKDLRLIYQYLKIYKKIRPDVICHNAIKPNIYGTIAAGMLGIPTINNISGLGTLFIKKSLSTIIAKKLYKISQAKAFLIFFQNPYDLKLFLDERIVNKSKCKIIPGSGVDTEKFKPILKDKKINDSLKFLFVGRLIKDKGIEEYIKAIKLISKKYNNTKFFVLGPFYEENSSSISKAYLDECIRQGYITYLGQTDNVQKIMNDMDCLVLPSYREGLSRVLIEASSMKLPIVTTDVPGCRDVVIDNITGFLCMPRDYKDLSLKIEKIILLSNENRKKMGERARERAIEVFEEKIIISYYKKAIDEVIF